MTPLACTLSTPNNNFPSCIFLCRWYLAFSWRKGLRAQRFRRYEKARECPGLLQRPEMAASGTSTQNTERRPPVRNSGTQSWYFEGILGVCRYFFVEVPGPAGHLRSLHQAGAFLRQDKTSGNFWGVGFRILWWFPFFWFAGDLAQCYQANTGRQPLAWLLSPLSAALAPSSPSYLATSGKGSWWFRHEPEAAEMWGSHPVAWYVYSKSLLAKRLAHITESFLGVPKGNCPEEMWRPWRSEGLWALRTLVRN